MSQLNSSATPFIGSSTPRVGSGAGGALQGHTQLTQHPQQSVMLQGLSHQHHSGSSSPIPQNASSSPATGGAVGTGAANMFASPQLFMNFAANGGATANGNTNRLGATGYGAMDPSMVQQLAASYNAHLASSGNAVQSYVSHPNMNPEDQRGLHQAQQQFHQLQFTPVQIPQPGTFVFAQQQGQLQLSQHRHPQQAPQQIAFATAPSVNASSVATGGGNSNGFGPTSPYAALGGAAPTISFSTVPSPSPVPSASMLGGVPGGRGIQNPMAHSKSTTSSLSSTGGFSTMPNMNVSATATSSSTSAGGRFVSGEEHPRNAGEQESHTTASTCTPNLSQSPIIRDVWEANLEEEFAVIRSLVADYPYVAMDTEFPGAPAKAVGNFDSPSLFYYQSLRVNVNMSKLIQVGITLLNEKGEAPENYCTWQFNFSFSRAKDIYLPESIRLLEQGGINFHYLNLYGINVHHFASLLLSSGLVRNPDVRWLAFHAGYDFGYLTKILYDADLPEDVDEFLKRFHLLFPSLFDVKHLLRQSPYMHSIGLDALAETLNVSRFGSAHQAGSDSLVTGHCYFRLLHNNFKGELPKNGNGILYGLTEDSAEAESGNAASGAFNASHHTIPTSGNGNNANSLSNPNGKNHSGGINSSGNR